VQLSVGPMGAILSINIESYAGLNPCLVEAVVVGLPAAIIVVSGRAQAMVVVAEATRLWAPVTPGFRRQNECEPCTCQDQLFTYTAVT
jgi:hypothetical protein